MVINYRSAYLQKWIFSCVFFLGCASSTSSGYLAPGTPPSLQEAIAYKQKNPLEIIAMQSSEISQLKSDNQSLQADLSQSKSSQSAAESQLSQLQEKYEILREKYQQTLKELEESQTECKSHKDSILNLMIEKTKIEQELLKMKIDVLQRESSPK